MDQLENINPKLYDKTEERDITAEEEDENVVDEFDSREIFDMIRSINDPEHPLTLEQLNVVEQNLVEVDNMRNRVIVKFTPTIPHCSMATLIGLSIRVQLLRYFLPDSKSMLKYLQELIIQSTLLTNN